MAESVTLGYWSIRGFAERVRILLEYLQVPYTQTIYTPENSNDWFGKLKPEFIQKNPAANLPYLKDGEKVVSESDAILIYLCHRQNRKDLLGENADDQVQIATVNGVFKDLSRAYFGYIYGNKSYQEFKDQAWSSLKPSLSKLNGLLGEKQWFASKLSWIDFPIAEFLQGYSLFCPNFAQDFPALKALQERVWQLPGVTEYIKSDRFKEKPVNWYPSAKWY